MAPLYAPIAEFWLYQVQQALRQKKETGEDAAAIPPVCLEAPAI